MTTENNKQEHLGELSRDFAVFLPAISNFYNTFISKQIGRAHVRPVTQDLVCRLLLEKKKIKTNNNKKKKNKCQITQLKKHKQSTKY